MKRPLWKHRWNEAEMCPGPTPSLYRVWLIIAFPWIMAKYTLQWKGAYQATDTWRDAIGVAWLIWCSWFKDWK